jgi:malate permease and related proteins
VFGQAQIPAFALVDLGQVLFVFFILLPALENLQGGKSTWKEVFLNFIKTPVILAILIGILLNLTGAYSLISNGFVFQWIWKAFELLAGLTSPLVAIVIGAELFFKRNSIKPALLTVGLRLMVWLPLAFLFNHFIISGLLHLDQTYEAAVLLMSILPAPFVVPIYLTEDDSNQRDMILSTLSIGTLISLLGAVVVRLFY